MAHDGDGDDEDCTTQGGPDPGPAVADAAAASASVSAPAAAAGDAVDDDRVCALPAFLFRGLPPQSEVQSLSFNVNLPLVRAGRANPIVAPQTGAGGGRAPCWYAAARSRLACAPWGGCALCRRF